MYQLIKTTAAEIETQMTTGFSVSDTDAQLFEINVDGRFAGFIAYIIAGGNGRNESGKVENFGTMIFVDSVEIRAEFRGQGLYRQICEDLIEELSADSIAGNNNGAKGERYTNADVNGYKYQELWVRWSE